MRRILLMILRNILFAPYWYIKVCIWAKSDKHSEEEKFQLLKHITRHANKGGRVKVHAYGLENIPEQDGFIFFPNHQGLYDVLAFLETCPRAFSIIMKKEVADIPFLKKIVVLLNAIAMDREDIRQSMKVIREVSNKVKDGRNYIIFPEGTRSKNGNNLIHFKGGSFKSAYYAKCPIVPAAIIDAYKAFDTKSIAKLDIQLHYLAPIYYEEYKDMKTPEIAALVKTRIEQAIRENEGKKFVKK